MLNAYLQPLPGLNSPSDDSACPRTVSPSLWELFGSLHAYVARKPHPRALGLCKISRTITASVRQQHEKKVCLSLQISATERRICHFRTGMLSRSRNLFGVRQVQQCGDLLKHKVQRCGDLPKRRHSVRQGVSRGMRQVQVEQYLKLFL